MSVRRALTFAFVDRYASLVVVTGASIVLARLLTPADVAVYSIGAVLLGFLASVRELGANQYLVREKVLDSDGVRAVWTVQLGMGALVGAAVALAAVPLAALYGDARMRDILFVLAAGCVFTPFGSMTHAWLTRELRFEPIAFARFTSNLAGAAVSIVLAWQGHGPMSLALGSLASTLVNAALLLPWRPRTFPWLPGLRAMRRVVSFGGPLTAADLLWTFGRGAPELLLGKLQDLTAAGLYGRASGLVAMFGRLVTEIVHGVALAWFSKEARQGGGFSRGFVKATGYVTALGWAFCGGLVFLAHPLIELLFGTQWLGAADLTRLLAIATVFGVPVTLCFAALVAAGAVQAAFRGVAVNTFVLVSLTALGAAFGLLQVGVATVVATAINAAHFLWITQREVHFAWRDLRAALLRSGLVAACASVGPALAWAMYGSAPARLMPPLLLGTLGGAAGFLLALVFFRHPLRDELRLLWSKVHALPGA